MSQAFMYMALFLAIMTIILTGIYGDTEQGIMVMCNAIVLAVCAVVCKIGEVSK